MPNEALNRRLAALSRDQLQAIVVRLVDFDPNLEAVINLPLPAPAHSRATDLEAGGPHPQQRRLGAALRRGRPLPALAHPAPRQGRTVAAVALLRRGPLCDVKPMAERLRASRPREAVIQVLQRHPGVFHLRVTRQRDWLRAHGAVMPAVTDSVAWAVSRL